MRELQRRERMDLTELAAARDADAVIAGGTAAVVRAVAADVADVWSALIEPAKLRQWLGTLTPPRQGGNVSELRVGTIATITRDDGDRFLLEVTRVIPNSILAFVWANFDIGIEETVTWTLTPTPTGCLVSVADDEPERTAEATVTRRSWWSEMLWLLEQFLTPGPATRTRLLREIDIRIEVPGTLEGVWGLLLSSDSHARWLPQDSSLADGGYLAVTDGQETWRAEVTDLHISAARHRAAFDVRRETWLHPTHCTIAIGQRQQGTLLALRHEGWEAISPDHDFQRTQRNRFVGLWVTALSRFTVEYVRRRDIPTISAADVKSRLDSNAFYLFDVNSREKRARGHVPGSIYVGPEPFSAAILPDDKEATLVFYCFSSI